MANKIKLISLLIVIIFLLAACSSGRQAENQESVQPEILMAHDCGFDKLKCCQEEPSCKYGQKCCLDPNDSKNNYCADTCDCGGLEEFCCSNNACNEALSCYLGKCAECGGSGQVCCQAGQDCREGFVCTGDHCLICGIAGHPCCQTGAKCDFENELSEKRTQCATGRCEACGSNGLPACLNQPKCIPGQLYNNGNCFLCGGINQPCCAGDLSANQACDKEKNLTCVRGFCEKTE
jgi:hypothetical protein